MHVCIVFAIFSTTFSYYIVAGQEVTVTNEEKHFCGGEHTKGLNEKCFDKKDCIQGMRCINGVCKCGPGLEESNQYGISNCVFAPDYNQHCSSVCKKPMKCVNNRCRCPESLEFNKNMGICFKECKKNELFDLKSGDCLPRCGEQEFRFNDTCLSLANLGENCEMDRQCKVGFSWCRKGICECKPGFTQEENTCETTKYKCPFGEPLSENGKIRDCMERDEKAGPKIKELACPDNYFCVRYAPFGRAGHCCPKIKEGCMIGEPLSDVTCDEKASEGMSKCPKETHECVNNVDGKRDCCPKPCTSNSKPWPNYQEDVYYKGSCYPAANYGERCELDEQCKNHVGVCREGTCQCGENTVFNVDQDRTMGCRIICKLSQYRDWTRGCLPRSKVGEACEFEEACPYNGKCNRGKCECKCSSELYADYLCVEEKSLQCRGPSGSPWDPTVIQKNPIFCMTKDMKKDTQQEKIDDGKFKLVEKCPNGTYCYFDRYSAFFSKFKLGICCKEPEMVCPEGSGKVNAKCDSRNLCEGGFCNRIYQPADDDSTEGIMCCSYDDSRPTFEPYEPDTNMNYTGNSTVIYPSEPTPYESTLERYGKLVMNKIKEFFKCSTYRQPRVQDNRSIRRVPKMKAWKRCHGLLAATLTPMNGDGSVNYDMIGPYIDHLVTNKVRQVFINGSGAEHISLSTDERKKLAEKFVTLGKGKLDLIVIQCGSDNLVNSKELAAHAQSIGADCVAAIAPTYFKAQSTDALVSYMGEVAKSCSDTPFMYYHFPTLTGITIRLCDFLNAAHEKFPNLIGAKFASPDLFDAGLSLQMADFKYDVIIGSETMLVGAMVMGIDSAIGGGFSILGKPCDRIYRNVHAGKLEEAKKDQYMVQKFWNLTNPEGSLNQCVASCKACMAMIGLDFGSPRLPLEGISDKRKAEIKKQLTDMGFFDWITKDSSEE